MVHARTYTKNSTHCVLLQILITTADFYSDEIKQNLFETMQELISLNIVPIINTNDAVSPPPQIDEDLAGVSDLSAPGMCAPPHSRLAPMPEHQWMATC